VTEELLGSFLSTAGIPDPDLLIRTSGEFRISNFLLWQLAYSEIYITPKFWPGFRRDELYAAVRDYQKRERRFGMVSEQVRPAPPGEARFSRLIKSVTGL
jgi:undecaprenyl diphosphate synthase